MISGNTDISSDKTARYIAATIICTLAMLPTFVGLSTAVQAQTALSAVARIYALPDTVTTSHDIAPAAATDSIAIAPLEPSVIADADTTLVEVTADGYSPEHGMERPFNPDPTRAVWMSALFPGLGQIYNRRYWKLPIIIGGFMGLGYATSWNNTQLGDYTRAYRDLMDSDPSTKSYMDFFPPTTSESDLDTGWLQRTLRSKKDYFRRNRDLCIICMVGLYLLCMLDAYVDASLSHFDISPDLSMDLQPAMFIDPIDRRPAVGLNWAFNF